jgi:hypothetical protein
MGWLPLGSEEIINSTNFDISVGSLLLPAQIGIEELSIHDDDPTIGYDSDQDGWSVATVWTAADPKFVEILVRVKDVAGNYIDWEPDNDLVIDDVDRPMITSVDSDTENGWWGPESHGLPIEIQLTADRDIIVLGTPFFSLKTGDEETGKAEYDIGSGSNILTFNYTPMENETTLGNTPAGTLRLKLTNNEAIIDLNGGSMYSTSGNKLTHGVINIDSPLLPKPNDNTVADGENLKFSLDENKNLFIDGVDPFEVYVAGNEFDQRPMSIEKIFTTGTEQRDGYYNYNSEQIHFRIYFRNTTDDITIYQLDDDYKIDMSLAHASDPDCNTAINGTGTNCGTIQLKAEAVMVGDAPVGYLDLGNPTTTSPGDASNVMILCASSASVKSPIRIGVAGLPRSK